MKTREISPSELKGGGYLAIPRGRGPHPGVVVIHAADGLTNHMKDVADRLAQAGYAALAVDLFGDRNRALTMTRFMTRVMRFFETRLHNHS